MLPGLSLHRGGMGGLYWWPGGQVQHHAMTPSSLTDGRRGRPLSVLNTRHGRSTVRPTGAATQGNVALYLKLVFVHDMPSGIPDVTDRRSRGLQRPWDSAGRHVYIRNKPEQLRGPLSPHRKDGTQNWEAGISGPSVVACVPLSTQGRLCVLDSQDSCCPLIFP